MATPTPRPPSPGAIAHSAETAPGRSKVSNCFVLASGICVPTPFLSASSRFLKGIEVHITSLLFKHRPPHTPQAPLGPGSNRVPSPCQGDRVHNNGQVPDADRIRVCLDPSLKATSSHPVGTGCLTPFFKLLFIIVRHPHFCPLHFAFRALPSRDDVWYYNMRFEMRLCLSFGSVAGAPEGSDPGPDVMQPRLGHEWDSATPLSAARDSPVCRPSSAFRIARPVLRSK